MGRQTEADAAYAKAKELGYETSTKNSTNSQPEVTRPASVAAQSNATVPQENTSNGWLQKGYELMANGSYEEAAKAIQKSIDLSPIPTNATLWDAKAQNLALAASLNGNHSEYNESPQGRR